MSFQRIKETINDVLEQLREEEDEIRGTRIEENQRDNFINRLILGREYLIIFKDQINQLEKEILEAIRNNNQNP
jgi:hypothetical protein